MVSRGYAACLAALVLAQAPLVVQAEELSTSTGAEAGAAGADGPGLDAHVAGLSASDTALRISAVRALGELADPAAIPHLAQVLQNDPVPEVRGWVARALAAFDLPGARQALVQAASSDPDQRVRGVSRRLAGLPDEAAPAAPAPPPPTAAVPQAPAVERQPRQVVIAPLPAPRRQGVPGRGLVIGGWTTFGVGYGLMVLVGAALSSDGDDWGLYMVIPVVGPPIAAGLGENDVGLAAVLWICAAGQAAGVIMAAIGHSRVAAFRRSQSASTRRGRASLSILPSGPRGSAGLTLAGRFF